MKLVGLIKSKTRRKILRFFFLNKEKKYFLRELERICSLPVGNIRRELILLERLGLFNREKKGRQTFYYLNKNSPLLKAVEEITKSLDKKRGRVPKTKIKKSKTEISGIKEDDLNLLFLKIKELENILDTLLHKKVEIEDFLNLGVVRNDRGKVLLIKRIKKEKGRNGSILTWAFPGGRQRLNETRSESVEREILTETGYRVKSIKEISARLHPQFPVFIVYHLCKLISPEPVERPKEPQEIAEIRWVKPQEIKNLFTTDFNPEVKQELGLK
jgi:ADP-ribose pyrophosphatase YjhB (NUDIX family)